MLSISYDGPSAYFRSTDDASPVGPCDACQFTSTRSPSALRLLRPGGFASSASARLVNLPALFHAGSSLGTIPSEVSPCSRRKVLSDSAFLHAVFQSCDCRSSEDFSYRIRCVLHWQRYSHRSWVAPLLVVISPSRMAFGLVQHFCRTPLLGFSRVFKHCCLSHVRSSEFHRTERLPVAGLPPWGFSSRQSDLSSSKG